MNAQDVKAGRTEALLGRIPEFFSSLSGYAVLALGVWLVMQDQYTLGGVMMFQGFLNAFMSPAMTLISPPGRPFRRCARRWSAWRT